MATRSYLLEEDFRASLERLKLPSREGFPSGVARVRQDFSFWLESRLFDRLSEFGDFEALEPILLGSWARHELLPKSDVDLLFAGPEDRVNEFVRKVLQGGLKLRARTPENPQDWSVGVEPFDVLALRSARALTPAVQAKLVSQTELAIQRRREILQSIRKEREDRRKRQDSIAGFLEPNLKYGVGGLRDIEQALVLRELFPAAYPESYPFEVLSSIKEELLYLRALLHLQGSSEVLSAHDQLEIASFLGNREGVGDLMKTVQSQLERASFYGDWIVAYAVSVKRRKSPVGLTHLEAAISQLKEKPNLDLQYRIRLKVDALGRGLTDRERGLCLQKAIQADAKDVFYVSLQRSRVLEVLIPDLKKLRGLVQHDHYHRFTADAHLVQTLREVQRVRSRKRALGPLSKLARDLTPQEWWILKLTALFHDLGKGRKGDHSREGVKLVDRYFQQWEYPEVVRAEVAWLVENHLLVSTAAFRQNPQSRSTWKRLFDRGVHGRRLILLVLFTAIDIRATNPEAWTDWKSQLLLDLVENLRSPVAQSFHKHLKYAGEYRQKGAPEWLLSLDPLLMQSLPPKILVEDLIEATRASKRGQDLPPQVLRIGKRLWVRMHRHQDQVGLFLEFVKRLYSLGLNVQLSAVATLPDVGVYNWFCLKADKTARQVQQWLSPERASLEVAVPKVQFQSVDLMSNDQEEWIFSFKGRDQRGILLAAAQSLHEEGLSLRWARVHTWGQQVEDVFSVRPSGQVEATLERLRMRFVT